MRSPMTDQERFVALLEEMGVVYALDELGEETLAWQNAPDVARVVVQAGTTGFYFDDVGKYIGYEAEEPRFFMSRVREGQECRREAI